MARVTAVKPNNDKDEAWLLGEKHAGVATPEFEVDRQRLIAGEPLAYVIGNQPFLGLTIHLDSKPLIPRPETEWWTEQLFASLPDASAPLTFLDLCAGSGAIGCAALAKLPRAQVFFGEIDAAHKDTVKKNIAENGLDASRADIRIGDLFEPFSNMQFDIIAANPPYVPAGRTLPKSVSDHEPAHALFSGNDGLDHIRRIAAQTKNHLAPHGVAWIECDRGHAEDVCVLFKDEGYKAEIRNDQYEKPRIVVVSR